MLDRHAELKFIGRESDVDRVERAAANAGRASAMVMNAQISGRQEVVDVWRDEEEVWQQRQEQAISDAPLGGSRLFSYALEIQSKHFGQNIIV